MGCSDEILRKRSRETRIYDVVVYRDMPKFALVTSVLDVLVDELPEEDLDALGSSLAPLEVAPAAEWSINDEAITYRDGAVVPIGKVLQGEISGGNDGYTYTIRILYARNDDPGPHEATVQLRIKD